MEWVCLVIFFDESAIRSGDAKTLLKNYRDEQHGGRDSLDDQRSEFEFYPVSIQNKSISKAASDHEGGLTASIEDGRHDEFFPFAISKECAIDRTAKTVFIESGSSCDHEGLSREESHCY